MNCHFWKRLNTSGLKTHEQMLSISKHEGNAGAKHNGISSHPCWKSCQTFTELQALARICRNKRSNPLLVGMKTSATITENKMEVPQKSENRSTIHHS